MKMKWATASINWDISVRAHLDLSSPNASEPVEESANNQDMSAGETTPQGGDESNIDDPLEQFRDILDVFSEKSMAEPFREYLRDIPRIPGMDMQYYMDYKYKPSADPQACCCDRCFSYLEHTHIQVIKFRDAFATKLKSIAEVNLQYRKSYAALYHHITGSTVRFSAHPGIDFQGPRCWDYQKRPESLLPFGTCHFRRRYKELEACHIRTCENKDALNKEMDFMIIDIEDILDKYDTLLAIVGKKRFSREELRMLQSYISYRYVPKSVTEATRASYFPSESDYDSMDDHHNNLRKLHHVLKVKLAAQHRENEKLRKTYEANAIQAEIPIETHLRAERPLTYRSIQIQALDADDDSRCNCFQCLPKLQWNHWWALENRNLLLNELYSLELEHRDLLLANKLVLLKLANRCPFEEWLRDRSTDILSLHDS